MKQDLVRNGIMIVYMLTVKTKQQRMNLTTKRKLITFKVSSPQTDYLKTV